MNMRNWPTVIAGGVGVVALAAAFVLTQGSAGQVTASKTGLTAVSLTGNTAPAVQQAIAPAPVAPSSGEAAPTRPGVEGIKVSGHWTIEVREPDGRLVSRQEFENALMTLGAESLAGFLAREQTTGWWRLNLNGTSSTSHACLSSGTPFPCLIGESSDTGTFSYLFKTLVVSSVGSGATAKMKSSGTLTAQKDGDIGTVSTWVGRCANTIAPNTGCGNTFYLFTQKTLTAPVSVLLNQQVVVTVEIGFN
ncbi:MAG: hypothetical protein HW384_1636 [Dehalococcoidia bacterium]|nr:hypothetical protein [Dehalococcoidia bacterium]